MAPVTAPPPDAVTDVGASDRTDRAGRGAVAALAIGTVVVIVARLWGQHVEWVLSEGRANIGAAPFFGRWNVEWRWWTLAAVAIGALGAWGAPRAASTWSWRRVLIGTWALHAAWAISLAASVGLHRLARPLVTRFEYFAAIDQVDEAGGVLDYLSGYVAGLPEAPLHVTSHPPGMVLFYWLLDRVGLAGPGWAAVAVLGLGTSTVVAVLVALRATAGEEIARRAAPVVAITPSVVWVASSADAVFAAIAAWGVALIVLAAHREHSRRLAVAGGSLACLALFFSYGVVLLLVLPAVVVVVRRRLDVAAWSVGAAAAVTALFTTAGFWWFDGLSETREFYRQSSAEFRPYTYSLVGNAGALVLSLGAAAVAGLGALALTWRRHRGLAVLVAPVFVAVTVASLSGLSTAETERIWLPFVPWLALAGGAVPPRFVRPLLVVSVAIGVVVQTWLRTPW